jgi:excisionase family DNA binding protein
MKKDTESEMRFLTAAEVADQLKLNHQVLVRKLQSGEIPAYKIGKDWRIEVGELREWLRSVSNQPAGPSTDEEEAIRRRFFEGGRLKQIPAKRSRREIVLRILSGAFEPGRDYRESEVNEILTGFHPDFCTLRRELVMGRHLVREAGRYRRAETDGSAAAAPAADPRSSSGSRRSGNSVPPART